MLGFSSFATIVFWIKYECINPKKGMKVKKTVFYLAIGALTAIMLFSIYKYFFNSRRLVGFS